MHPQFLEIPMCLFTLLVFLILWAPVLLPSWIRPEELVLLEKGSIRYCGYRGFQNRATPKWSNP